MKVTILCALYESGIFIESKLESLSRLIDVDKCEVIFINCLNKDNESSKLQRYLDLHKGWKEILLNEHVNLYKAWNIGIEASTGDYICSYNADDQWRPDYVVKMVEYLDTHDDAIVTSGVLITDVANQIYPSWGGIIGKIPALPYPKSTAGPSPMWRRSLHSKYGLFGNYRVIGDARFWEKLHAGGEKFGLVTDDLVLYYANCESLERRHDANGVLLRVLDIEEESHSAASTTSAGTKTSYYEEGR